LRLANVDASAQNFTFNAWRALFPSAAMSQASEQT
jgi:hypothetical protein